MGSPKQVRRHNRDIPAALSVEYTGSANLALKHRDNLCFIIEFAITPPAYSTHFVGLSANTFSVSRSSVLAMKSSV